MNDKHNQTCGLTIEAATQLFDRKAATSYLNSCSRGLLPMPARTALAEHAEELASGAVNKSELFLAVEDTRAAFARLISADADEIAYTKNVSEGLNMIAAAIDWRAGDNVVVCLDMEHPNNVYPWFNQRARHDIEVRTVENRDGHVDSGRLIDAIDDQTRLVTMPSVTFAPGFRAEIAAVGQVCRERGIFLLVDAVQSVGLLKSDVKQLGVDGLVVSTQKGLCGLYGMGFLYCRRDWAERLVPAYLARFGIDLGSGAHEAAMGTSDYDLMPGARRFDLGNYNYPAIVVAQQSLKILERVGTAAIETHVKKLSARLIESLLDLNLPVAGGVPGSHTGSIVCIGEVGKGGHDTTDDLQIAHLSKQLEAAGVVHTIRRGMVRLAFHLYNDESDIERVLDVARVHKAVG